MRGAAACRSGGPARCFSVARSALDYRAAQGGGRRAGAGADGRARTRVSALRLSAHPGLSRPRRARDERRAGPSAVAGGGLQVPRKRPRRRVASGRPRPQAPTGANQVWAYDFVFDRCANGQQLKCLTVTDEWTREGLAIEVDGRIRSARVIEVLARLVSERGAPLYLRSDNGPEFVSRALLAWIVDAGHRRSVDRSRQALAEWRRRELQRQVPRRVPAPRGVGGGGGGEGRDRGLAQALQRRAAPFEPRLFDAHGVRGKVPRRRR